MAGKNEPLNALIQFVQHLAEGETEFDAPLITEIPGADEAQIQQLNQALLALQERLQGLSQMAGQIAGGDLSASVTQTSTKDELGATLSKALGNLRRTFAQVIAGAEALGTAEAQLNDTATNTGRAVQETVAAFGKVTSNTFDQFSAIKEVNEGVEQLTQLTADNPQIQEVIQTVRHGMETISTTSQENAKITVSIRLTTNKLLEQVDRIVVTSRSLKGMTIGLQNTMAPYILATETQREEALKIAYLPITDHLVLPLTYLKLVQTAGGLPLQILRRGSWPEIVDALEDEADGALILAPLAIKLFNEGLPIKIIMATHRNGSALVLKKEYETLDELAGRTVGIPHLHSIHNVLLYKALEEAQVGYGSVEVRQDPPPLMPFFLQRGSLDGFISAEPFPEVALNLGAGRIEFLSKDVSPNHMCCVLVMRDEVLREQPEKVARLIKNFVEIGQHIKDDASAAARDVAPFYGVIPAVMERVLTNPPDRITYDDLELHKEEFIELGRSMMEMGLLTELPDVDGLVDDQFFQQAVSGA